MLRTGLRQVGQRGLWRGTGLKQQHGLKPFSSTPNFVMRLSAQVRQYSGYFDTPKPAHLITPMDFLDNSETDDIQDEKIKALLESDEWNTLTEDEKTWKLGLHALQILAGEPDLPSSKNKSEDGGDEEGAEAEAEADADESEAEEAEASEGQDGEEGESKAEETNEGTGSDEDDTGLTEKEEEQLVEFFNFIGDHTKDLGDLMGDPMYATKAELAPSEKDAPHQTLKEYALRRLELLKKAPKAGAEEPAFTNAELAKRCGVKGGDSPVGSVSFDTGFIELDDPVLANESKEVIFMLRKSDAENWSWTKLAATFGIRVERVKAIVRLQEMQFEEIRAGRVLDPTLEVLSEMVRGKKNFLMEEVTGTVPKMAANPLGVVHDEDLDAALAPRRTVQRRMRHELEDDKGFTPLPNNAEVERPKLAGGKRAMVSEIGKHVSPSTRQVIMQELNGSLRQANFEERKKANKLWRLGRSEPVQQKKSKKKDSSEEK